MLEALSYSWEELTKYVCLYQHQINMVGVLKLGMILDKAVVQILIKKLL